MKKEVLNYYKAKQDCIAHSVTQSVFKILIFFMRIVLYLYLVKEALIKFTLKVMLTSNTLL